jgi:hypothetical protein
LVGQKVKLHGKFEFYGKAAPYIEYGGAVVYLVPNMSKIFVWRPEYAQLHDKTVAVQGVLKFRHFDQTTSAEPVGVPQDYYYFEAETVTVQLSQSD